MNETRQTSAVHKAVVPANAAPEVEPSSLSSEQQGSLQVSTQPYQSALACAAWDADRCPQASIKTAHVAATAKQVTTAKMTDEMGVERVLHYTAVTTPEGGKISEKDLFDGEHADLILGVDVTGNTKGHMYAVIDGVRFDGRMFYAAHSETKKDWKLSPGVVVRYPEIPAENKKALVDWLSGPTNLHAPSCVAALCTAIYGKAGFKGGPSKPFLRYWFPTTFLKNLVAKGLTGADGKRLNPQVVTINADVDSFWSNLPSWKQVPKFFFKVLFRYIKKPGKA